MAKKILIVKSSAIGDVIQSFPVVEYVKNRFPEVTIDWVVEKPIAALLKAHPGINHVIEVDTKVWRRGFWKNRKRIREFLLILRETSYDILFDLQGNTKSGLITFFAKAKKKVGFSWRSVAEKPNFFTTNQHFAIPTGKDVRQSVLSLIQQFFKDDADFHPQGISLQLSQAEETRLQSFSLMGSFHPKVMVCFGSKWQNKQFSEKTLTEFLGLIHKKIHPHFFFIFSNIEEKKLGLRLHELFPQSDALGDMSLPLLQRFMRQVDCLIGVDSAALHLCGTTGTPSFSIFGPSSAFAYKPSGDQHQAYQGNCPYGQKFTKRCPLLRTCKTGACIKEIPAAALFDYFSNFWNKVLKSTPLSTI